MATSSLVLIGTCFRMHEYRESRSCTSRQFYNKILCYCYSIDKSVLGISGHEGNALQKITYSAFGERIGTAGNANGNQSHYTGREENAFFRLIT